MCIATLDAEKCFDSIWHDGLFFKLIDILSETEWRFMYKWYKSLDVVIKWNGVIHYDSYFKVTRGTKQGSILSPTLFNIFLSELMEKLQSKQAGLRIGDKLYNSFAYADDITLFSYTIPGLQSLIDLCYSYSRTWRFKFGIAKSKCMLSGYKPNCFSTPPEWFMGDQAMELVDNLDVLGVNFTSNMKYDIHINTRVQKCKRSMYALSNSGMRYPGLSSSTKSHLFRSVCQPTLMYGVECLNVTSKNINDLNSAQGSVIKHVCGLSKRARHSALMQALDVTSAADYVKKSTISLYNRTCAINIFMSDNVRIPGTLVDRVLGLGACPLSIYNKYTPIQSKKSGLVDSIRAMLLTENFIKPWSDEYLLVKLLTRSF